RRCRFFAKGNEDEVGQVERDVQVELRLIREEMDVAVEFGIGQTQRSNERGAGDAEPRERRLNARAREDRELGGAVGGERLGEEVLLGLGDLGVLDGIPMRLDAGPLANDLTRLAEARAR